VADELEFKQIDSGEEQVSIILIVPKAR